MEAVNSVDSKENCIVLSDDPKLLNSLIDQHVIVRMIKSSTYTGFIHAIDPISKSLILSVPKDDNFQTVLIPGHAVVSLTKTEPLTCEKPRRKTLATFTEEEIVQKREKVVAWLKKNLLPAKIQNGAVDVGNVLILPPFSSNDICTENPMVAGQIRKILESMPNDFVA